jgi:hypothetical protein
VNRIDDIAWRPGFNDPDPLSWIAFAAYAIASVLCIRAALCRGDAPIARQSRRAWLLFGIALAFLGLNLQLDLHVLFFQWLRRTAEIQGWYERRRSFQHAFMVILSVALLAGVIFGARCFRFFVRTQKLAIFGALLVIGYVLARNMSFNHFDDRAGSIWDMKDSLRLFELSGVTAIGIAAWRFTRAGKER